MSEAGSESHPQCITLAVCQRQRSAAEVGDDALALNKGFIVR